MLRTEFCLSSKHKCLKTANRANSRANRSGLERRTLIARERSFYPRILPFSDLLVTCATKSAKKSKKGNKLNDEKSLYLLGFANNPVDWHPWSTAAFDKARAEDKPIFLSIGYLNCHWCRVMEEESFKNAEVAKLLNENFVPIKVDREEMPDVDRFYSIYLQWTLGYSGWPLNIFLTPDLDPIFGATYMPTPALDEIPSFTEILNEVLDSWANERVKLLEAAKESTESMKAVLACEPLSLDEEREDGTSIVDDVMDSCLKSLTSMFDHKYGGFDGEVKFPRTSSVKFLLRYFSRNHETLDQEPLGRILKMILYSLGALHDGGLHDHVGGGFHRHCVDRVWHQPQFEKTLVDNAQIAQIYLTFGQLTRHEVWFETAQSTLDYVLRELKSTEGGFMSGQSAESVDAAGKLAEGVYYVWQKDEIDAVLSEKEREAFNLSYNVIEDGNIDLSKSDKADPILTNVLVIQRPIPDVAEELEMEELELRSVLETCRRKLFEERQKRAKPDLDEKVMAGYNGLAISAFAEASRVLKLDERESKDRPFPVEDNSVESYLDVASEVGEFLIEKLWDEERKVLRRFLLKGKAYGDAFAEDYAYVVAGFLDLYSCSGRLKWLTWAMMLQDRMDELFWDSEYSGYFMSSEDNQNTSFRMKCFLDAEEPSASAVALSNLLRLSGIMQRTQTFDEKAKQILEAFAAIFDNSPASMSEFASSVFLWDIHPALLKIVVVGNRSDSKTQKFLDKVHASYTPAKSLIAIDPADKACVDFWQKHNEELMDNLGSLISFKQPGRKTKKSEKEGIELPAAFICENFDCYGPIFDPEVLEEYLLEGSDKLPSAQRLSGEEEKTEPEDMAGFEDEDDEGIVDVEATSSARQSG